MSFRCSGSDNLASALKQSSAVEYFVSQLPDSQIGTHFSRDCLFQHPLKVLLVAVLANQQHVLGSWAVTAYPLHSHTEGSQWEAQLM